MSCLCCVLISHLSHCIVFYCPIVSMCFRSFFLLLFSPFVFYFIFSTICLDRPEAHIFLLGPMEAHFQLKCKPLLKPKIEAQNPIVKHQSRPISTGCRFQLRPGNKQSPVSFCFFHCQGHGQAAQSDFARLQHEG